MKKIIIANWKLQVNNADSIKLANKLVRSLANIKNGEVVICPCFVSLREVGVILGNSNILMGAQNSFWEGHGPYTGEISAKILKEIGCKYVILGHSERREYLHEDYEMIHKKVKRVVELGGITPVVCVGETLKDRKKGRQEFVLSGQLEMALGGMKSLNFREIIIAYEPVWAIGTGEAINPEEARQMQKIIKKTIENMFGLGVSENNFRYIYGGSINEENVEDYSGIDGIDGFLVGGASLKVASFKKIINTFFNKC